MTPEILCFLTFAVCAITILMMAYAFKQNGLFVYTIAAVIASNIQVLQLTKYNFMDQPVALGTVVFSTMFAVDNILTEYYGAQIAKKNVFLSFAGYLFFVVVMKISAMHPFADNTECVNLHEEINKLFSPSFTLLIASLISYISSQLIDVFIFAKLKIFFRGRHIHGRSFCAMALSTFIDNFIFSFLAWIVFAANPISMSALWTTYIVATYAIRLIITILCVPLVRLTGIFIERKMYVREF